MVDNKADIGLMVFFEDALQIELANNSRAIKTSLDIVDENHICYEFKIRTVKGRTYTSGPIDIFLDEFTNGRSALAEHLLDVSVKYLRADMKRH